MSQHILLIVTEINPGLNAFLSKKDPATQTPLGIPRVKHTKQPDSKKGEREQPCYPK